jgi:hypothetical protein
MSGIKDFFIYLSNNEKIAIIVTGYWILDTGYWMLDAG